VGPAPSRCEEREGQVLPAAALLQNAAPAKYNRTAIPSPLSIPRARRGRCNRRADSTSGIRTSALVGMEGAVLGNTSIQVLRRKACHERGRDLGTGNPSLTRSTVAVWCADRPAAFQAGSGVDRLPDSICCVRTSACNLPWKRQRLQLILVCGCVGLRALNMESDALFGGSSNSQLRRRACSSRRLTLPWGASTMPCSWPARCCAGEGVVGRAWWGVMSWRNCIPDWMAPKPIVQPLSGPQACRAF